MKITDISNIGVEHLQPQSPEAAKVSSERQALPQGGSGLDVIHLSPKARLMQKASQIIAETPEVRPEKVSALQEAISQGTYKVDTAEVAKSLLIHHLTES